MLTMHDTVRRLVGLMLALCGLLFVSFPLYVAAQSGSRATPSVRTERDVFAPGEPIVVFFEHPDAQANDFITLVPRDFPERRYQQRFILKRNRSGSHAFRPLQPGPYQVRLVRRQSRLRIKNASRSPRQSLRVRRPF